MKKVLCVLLSALILFSGCLRSTYQLDRLNSEECAEINERAEGQGATLTMKGNEVNMGVENFRVELDSSYWMIDSDNQIWASAPTSMIKKITITNHAKGLLYGSLLAAPSLVLGVIILNGSQTEKEERIDPEHEGLAKLIGGIFLIGVGVGILLPILGAIEGVKYTYIFPDADAAIDLDTTSIDISQKVNVHVEGYKNFIEVEVTSVESDKFDNTILNIIWEAKEIRLSRAQVIKTHKRGDKLYITISKVVYENKFIKE